MSDPRAEPEDYERLTIEALQGSIADAVRSRLPYAVCIEHLDRTKVLASNQGSAVEIARLLERFARDQRREDAF